MKEGGEDRKLLLGLHTQITGIYWGRKSVGSIITLTFFCCISQCPSVRFSVDYLLAFPWRRKTKTREATAGTYAITPFCNYFQVSGFPPPAGLTMYPEPKGIQRSRMWSRQSTTTNFFVHIFSTSSFCQRMATGFAKPDRQWEHLHVLPRTLPGRMQGPLFFPSAVVFINHT